MDVLRYYHTLRHLKPVQVYGRLAMHFRWPRPDSRPAPPLRGLPRGWVEPAAREPSMLEPSRFRYLNVERDVELSRTWEDPAWERLWTYNLHYFDDLNARDAAERRAWHAKLIERWIAVHPPGQGTPWEAFPLSLRLVNWTKWALSRNTLQPAAVHSLAVQTRYLTKRLEYHLLGNHLLSNAKALVFAGWYFDGPEADRWAAKGLAILSRQLPEQILADGGHFERSPMYHSLVLEDLLDLWNLACARGLQDEPFVRNWAETIQDMRRWLAAMCHPDGEISFFNDAAIGIAPSPAELDAYAKRLDLGTASPPANGVTHLAESGYVRLQNSKAVAILDVGEIGPDYLPGHAHADTLSFEFSVGGSRFLVNSGTSTYEAGALREAQRGTAAHNTVVVDGENSSDVWGSFRVARRARPCDLETSHDEGMMSVTCSHDGYRRLPGNVTHRRRWTLRDRALEIDDFLHGAYRAAVAHFCLHPDIRVIEDRPAAADGLRFSAGDSTVTWGGAHQNDRLERATYYPQFGASRENLCLVAEVRDGRANCTLSWNA